MRAARIPELEQETSVSTALVSLHGEGPERPAEQES